MQTQKANVIQWVAAVAVILLLIGSFTWMKPAPQEPVVVPTAQEIASQVLAQVEVPTAAEIAANVKVPEVETYYSVQDDRKSLALDLILEEMDDDDFKEELAAFLENENNEVDIEDPEDDVLNYDIRDTEWDWFGLNDDGEVLLDIVVEFYNNGDEVERARFEVLFELEDFDWNEDYDDADVAGYGDFELVRFYGDLD